MPISKESLFWWEWVGLISFSSFLTLCILSFLRLWCLSWSFCDPKFNPKHWKAIVHKEVDTKPCSPIIIELLLVSLLMFAFLFCYLKNNLKKCHFRKKNLTQIKQKYYDSVNKIIIRQKVSLYTFLWLI